MACADDAKASAKATANNLIIVTLPLKSPRTGLSPLGAHQPTSGPSAQLTDLYSPESVVGRQVACVVNLPPRRIGPFQLEALKLGFPTNMPAWSLF
jgi:hypothetical protein